MSAETLPVVTLRGVDLHALTERGCIEAILGGLAEGRGGWVVTPNLDILRRADQEADFRVMIERADLRVADGMPLVWASRLQGTPLPERVTGSNLVWSLSEAAGTRGHRLFLLGGDPGTAERAAVRLAERCPGLVIAGHDCPPFGFERDPREWERLEALLAAARPEIIYVALGSPKQEQLIERLRHVAPEAWWLGIGISFSFITGDVRRAPRWMQRIGLEWLHRLSQEPRRLFRRYLIDGLPFAGRLMISAAGQRGGRGT